MDTDWCLNCSCHFQGAGPFCSDCADPSYDYTPTWSPNGSAAIIAWASEIPPSAPIASGASTPSSVRSSFSTVSSPSATFLPPKLLRSNQPVPPTLCMTASPSAPPSPSRPIYTPSAAASMSRFGDPASIGKASVLSAPTESSLATPASPQSVPFPSSKHPLDKPSIFGTIATHVRSWVSPTPPLVASPPKPRFPATNQSDAHKFTVVARNNHCPHPSAVNFAFSTLSSPNAAPIWHLSSTILIDTSKSSSKIVRDVRGSQLPYKSRGRKSLRAVV